MDRSCVISLVSTRRTRDARGIWRDVEDSVREVFAQVDSVSRAEFFAGGQTGFKPELKFTLFFADYRGEDTLIYGGTYYAVYRTYHARDDTMELYCQRRTGINGTEDGG